MTELYGYRIDQGEVIAVLQAEANAYVPLDNGGIAVVRKMPHNMEVGIDNADWLAAHAEEKGKAESAYFYRWVSDQITLRQEKVDRLSSAGPQSMPKKFEISSLGLSAQGPSIMRFPDPVRLSRPLLLDYFHY